MPMFRIKKVEPSSAPCGTHGRLYVIALGQWKLMLFRSPIAEPMSMYVVTEESETELPTRNWATYEWSSDGPSDKA